MKKFIFISALYVLFFTTAFAEVSQFVFITPEQSVDVNVISSAITIQSQNNGGVSEAVTETTDLVFNSTSATGKFIASSGKPASKTMSKNTAKRSFYYIDTTPGTYLLAIKTTGRTSKKSFIISQKIVVGNQTPIAEVKSIPVPSTPTIVPAVPAVPVLSKPVIVPVKTETTVKKKVEAVKPLPVKNPTEVASSTVEIKEKESSVLASVIYTAPPKTSALESFLWLPRKIWGTVKSIFQ